MKTNMSVRYFNWVTGHPWLVLLLALLSIIAGVSSLPTLTKDTSADAFIHPDNPAIVYRDKVEEVFGLKDPMVVMVANADGVFNVETLAFVKQLTSRIKRLDNVDPDSVVSLATEKHITGDAGNMFVEKFFKKRGDHFATERGSAARAEQVKAAINDFPLYQGSLVARDNTATLIAFELMDDAQAPGSYDEVMGLLNNDGLSIPANVQLHVAGAAAVSGYLATYIDQDARRLNPLAGLIITVILAVAFFSFRAAVLPNLIVAGTVLTTFGLMAAADVSFYVITNGLIGNLIGMAVADAIHIFSQYYEELAEDQAAGNAGNETTNRELVVRAMVKMIRPITLTTVTTIAGFLALAFSSEMPPAYYFGLFGALGVALAWLYSLTLLPAAMTLWRKKRLPRPFRPSDKPDWAAGKMTAFGRAVLARPAVTLMAAAVVSVVGVVGATQIVANDAPIENFKPTEALYKADKAINAKMDGTYYLDVVIEAPQVDDLLLPENMRRIEKLQAFLLTLPNVNGTTSYVDYVKQMNRAVDDNKRESYRIPDSANATSQLFFLYNSPTDFEDEHENFQRALVRAKASIGDYANNKVLIAELKTYLDTAFPDDSLTATITGTVNVNFHWIDGIASSHAYSVLLSFLAVLLVAMLVFRSPLGGVLAILPVAMAVLLVYAVMGFGGIWLGTGTSMFAAIAIGLGIDFAIHTLDRLRELVREGGFDDETLLRLYPSTGRALFFNFVAIASGFGVLMTSDVPPLVRFGLLVAVSVATAFVAAMTVVPALVKLIQPTFLVKGDSK